jgi:hypothetical protein
VFALAARFRLIVLTTILALSAGWFSPSLTGAPIARAGDTTRQPIAVVSVAGVDRVLEDLDYVFESVGRKDQATFIKGFLVNLNDLKGIDRTRPLGALVYLPPRLEGEPDVVGFIPVSRIGDLQVTLRISNQISLEHVSGEDRYELRTPDTTLPVRLAGGYAFFAKQSSLLDGELPDVAALTSPLAKQYDVALSLSRDGLPAAAIDRALDKIQADADRELARKENEGEAEFQLRTRVARAVFDLAEDLVSDGKSLVVGANLSSTGRHAELEALLTVAASSPLAAYLKGTAASGSTFAAQTAEPNPLTMTSTWTLLPEGTDIATEVLRLAQREVGKQFQVDLETAVDHPVRRLFDALQATARQGQVDSFVQFIGEPPGKFVLVSGTRVAQADAVARAIEDILPHVRKSPDVKDLQMNVATIGGVTLHRVVGQKMRKQDVQLYGDDAGLYIGAGESALWMALGGADAIGVLQEVIPRVAARRTAAADAPPAFRAVLHLTSWLGMIGAESSANERQFAAAARQAFTDPDADTLRLELVPGMNGLRLRVRFDEGYIRLVGLALSEHMRQR